ncbi:hypothetical protein [Pseudovibrio ascidiaceicola]|uniref:Nmad2 family putative nucleotide modification protein n=1 Tax=Pseudovibrio ascidiaceicola TaxID=285279 RepID=UPI001FCC651D|nr:hypothetical protein [Pseudovibrio ascidiaceicola]
MLDVIPRVYIYVISHDLGFSPNPFHGVCTLACCKPIIRKKARANDWIIGMGGTALRAVGRCIYAMRVSTSMSFDEYWAADEFRVKRPTRNGSRKTMVGDNIYSRSDDQDDWKQQNSVHSQPSGAQDDVNTIHDTSVNRVLVSDHFVYWGGNAPTINPSILEEIGYRNGRGHRVFSFEQGAPLVDWVHEQVDGKFNRVLGDPFQFRMSDKRYSKDKNRLI